MQEQGIWQAILRKRRYFSEATWVIAGQAVAGAGAIASVRLLSQAMSPSSYGEFSLALTGTMLIHLFSSGPISQAATRYFASASETGRVSSYLRALRNLVGGMYVGLTALTVCGWIVMSAIPSLGMWRSTAGLWLLYSLVYAGTTIADAIQTGARRRAVAASHQAVAQWLRPAAALLCFALWGASCNAALAGFAIASILIFGSELLFVLQTAKRSGAAEVSLAPTFDTVAEYRKRIVGYAWPFASYGLLSWLQLASDRWLLEIFKGPASVAAYSVSYQLGYQPMNLFATAIGAFITPILFQTAGDGQDPSRVRKAEKMNDLHTIGLLGFTALATLLTLLLRKHLFAAFTAPSYASFASDLPMMVAAGGIFSCGQALTINFFLGARSNAIVGPKVVSSILGIALNYIGVRYFGVQGAVGATLLFSILYVAIVSQQLRIFRRAALVQGVLVKP